MSGSFSPILTLAVGAVLVAAIAVLWLSSVRSVIRVMAAQGIALGLVATILGAHLGDAGLVATAAVVLAVKGVAVPVLLGRASGASRAGGAGGAGRAGGAGGAGRAGGAGAGSSSALDRERRPLVNVPASLVASAALIVLAFAAARGVAAFVGTTAGALVPVGLATLLVGFLVLVTRRRPVFQMVGLLLVDNGIALMAFLCTAGVPFLIELGVSLDVLLGVVVLMVLAQRLRTEFGDLDLDQLQELHD